LAVLNSKELIAAIRDMPIHVQAEYADAMTKHNTGLPGWAERLTSYYPDNSMRDSLYGYTTLVGNTAWIALNAPTESSRKKASQQLDILCRSTHQQ
jgi:hypothetical protein